ncbi:hypothetical protein AAFF_G00319730 [Aldrovandia affinis]|uniref:Putative monooxygenase p33MONOX n=1 Tax=Aldrovandia affinis TaxID=143900 RepID=A0AAD7SMS9_9TELE|nr:hypothetical protein AAFF_G00319730 [Aldrovandia affinis]
MMSEMSLPIRMARRCQSYDDAMTTPMLTPPSDMSFNTLWKSPVIPNRKFRCMSEGDGSGTPKASVEAVPTKLTVPVVKAKASSFILNSLMTKQTQESIQKFEQQAGLTDAGYTPHKGLTTEETHYHRMAEASHRKTHSHEKKLKMPSGDFREDKQRTSAQSTPSVTPSATPTVTPCVTPSVTPCVTPSVTPHTSPRSNRRSWFGQSSVAFLPISEFESGDTSADMGGTEGGGGGERWSLFGTRPTVSKSSTDPGNLTLQSYQGGQKAMDMMKARVAEDPVVLKAPKIEITGLEVKKHMPRPHKLKPRDMNVLTPSGF